MRAATYLRRAPTMPLAAAVDHLWVFEDFDVPVGQGVLFADGCADLMFYVGEPMSVYRRAGVAAVAGAWVSGPRARPIGIGLASRRFTMVGARLRASGLGAVLGAPAAEVFDRSIDLREFWGGHADEASDRIAAAPTPAARLDELERVLLAATRGARSSPEGLAAVVDRVRVRPDRITVADMQRELGISHRHLTRLFHVHVGMSPKLFQRVCRFRRLLDRAGGDDADSWSQLALLGGYSDQPHLCADVREFSGVTPRHLPRASDGHPVYMPLPLPDRGALARYGQE